MWKGSWSGRTFHVVRTDFRTKESTGMCEDPLEGDERNSLAKSEYF